jgi:hypothetical protein
MIPGVFVQVWFVALELQFGDWLIDGPGRQGKLPSCGFHTGDCHLLLAMDGALWTVLTVKGFMSTPYC